MAIITAAGVRNRRFGKSACCSLPFLNYPPHNHPDRYLKMFRKELEKLRYVEGTNLIFDRRVAEGHFDRLANLANEVIE
jgi:hypothetical protein